MLRPTIVLVPGAWHTPVSFDRLVPHLSSAGYPVVKIALPSVGAETPCSDTSADAAAIRTVLDRLVEASQDIMLVVHSYGGIPAGDAAEGLSSADRAAQGEQGGIAHIVYLTSAICAEGMGLIATSGATAPAPWVEMSEVSLFYQCLRPRN